MIEADKAVTELRRRHTENRRQLQLEQRFQTPNSVRIRTLEHEGSLLFTKLQRVQELHREVKSLESTLSMKMMNRYPAEQAYRLEYKRQLHRVRKTLKDLAMKYQPKETPKRPGLASQAKR